MLVTSKVRFSLHNNLRFRGLIFAERSTHARKASSNASPWEENGSGQSYTVPLLVGFGAVAVGAGVYIYFNRPEILENYFGINIKSANNDIKEKFNINEPKQSAVPETQSAQRQAWDKTLAGASAFHQQLETLKTDLIQNVSSALKHIDEYSQHDMSLETFLHSHYKRLQLSLLLRTMLTQSHEFNKKFRSMETTLAVDSDIRNQATSAREKLLSSWNGLCDNFLSISFPPIDEEKLEAYWTKYYRNLSKYSDYTTSRQAFAKAINQTWPSTEVAESELMDKVLQIYKRLEQVDCLLVERFDHKLKMTPLSATLEGMPNDPDQRGTVDEIVRSKVEEVRENFETEFNLKVEAEKAKLNMELSEEFNDKLQTIKVEYAQKLAETLAKLHAIESAVDEKASSQRRALFSHYMWLACESLRSQLFRDVEIGCCSEQASELDKLLKPLHQFTRKIEQVNSNENNPFVSSVLASVPEIARTRGVYTEEMLKLRFNRVLKICYRLADVNEERNSIYAHVLSNLKAALTIKKTKDVPQDIDLESADNYTLLQYAECAVERGDIAVCVKILNHLKGKPAEVVYDWLEEARLFLETKQAAHCLSLFSTATGFSGAPLA